MKQLKVCLMAMLQDQMTFLQNSTKILATAGRHLPSGHRNSGNLNTEIYNMGKAEQSREIQGAKTGSGSGRQTKKEHWTFIHTMAFDNLALFVCHHAAYKARYTGGAGGV
ncbi:hypothetical protein XENOCAPTIV_004362 [Xenoophorus captivus]|uniref:Uncharacterized protein n=1 Tax=Xenoophorus captivus TaxID=1517983 RepID=A0ABV0Q8X1_9TELE